VTSKRLLCGVSLEAVVLALMLVGCSHVQRQPPVATPGAFASPEIVVSQGGYRSDLSKLALYVADQAPASAMNVVSADTGQIVMTIPAAKLNPSYFDKDTKKRVSWIRFDDVTAPGEYRITSSDGTAQSGEFPIGPDVWRPLTVAACRMYYFQRCGVAHGDALAGKWATPAYHCSAGLIGRVTDYSGGGWQHLGDTVVDATAHDTSGGWYDAGDPNLYTKNECIAIDELLLAQDTYPDVVKAAQLRIPESDNGQPDLLNEARFGAEYLLKIQAGDGGFYDRVLHTDDPNGPTKIAPECSGATLCAVGALAWTAAEWNKRDPAFAALCLKSAERGWALMRSHPSPWPVGADGKPQDIGSIDGNYGDEQEWACVAAACLDRATGRPDNAAQTDSELKSTAELRVGYARNRIFICDNVMLGPKETHSTIVSFAKALAPSVLSICSFAAPTPDRPFGAGNYDGYYWGSNAAVAEHAAEMLWWSHSFGSPQQKAKCADAAEQYLEYLTGRNQTGWCYVTNYTDAPGSRCVPVMFSFLCRADRFQAPDSDHVGRVGCFPGYLVGGPQLSVTDFPADPSTAYATDYVHLEPSIIYQCSLVMLSMGLTRP